MILFTLTCHNQHQFEGWFRNSEAYETQSKAGMLSCPLCATTKVHKAPMAPRITKSLSNNNVEKASQTTSKDLAIAAHGSEQGAAKKSAVEQNVQVATVSKKDNFYKMLRQIRQEIEKKADNVGSNFAEEARKIHLGESQERPIYGTATNLEAKQLREEGIDFIEVPWLPKTND